MEIPKITLCIPTYNRFDTFLVHNLPKYLANHYIDEIVISDENGEDLNKIAIHFPNELRLKLFKNETRLGPFRNKDVAVSHATNEWVCLMDSDNFAPLFYFDAWAEYIRKNGINNKNIYAPCKTIPQKNHGGFDFIFGMNVPITKKNVNEIIKNPVGTTLLNTGNYIFHKDNFLDTTDVFPELHSKLDVQDVLFKNALLLIKNSTIHVVPYMMYDHIVHNGSFFLNNISDFDNANKEVLKIYEYIQTME